MIFHYLRIFISVCIYIYMYIFVFFYVCSSNLRVFLCLWLTLMDLHCFHHNFHEICWICCPNFKSGLIRLSIIYIGSFEPSTYYMLFHCISWKVHQVFLSLLLIKFGLFPSKMVFNHRPLPHLLLSCHSCLIWWILSWTRSKLSSWFSNIWDNKRK